MPGLVTLNKVHGTYFILGKDFLGPDGSADAHKPFEVQPIVRIVLWPQACILSHKRLNMNWLQDVTAILFVSVASMQLGLLLAWAFLTLLLNSLRPINILAKK
jgi:hypothetical protein